MSLLTVKRLAARIFGAGESRVKILDEVKAREAITGDDVRSLIKEKKIVLLSKKGVGRGKARWKQSRITAGRRRGKGSRKGSREARLSSKLRWMHKVRAQRKLLHSLREMLVPLAYRKVSKMIKGNAFADKKRLKLYLEENKLIQGALK